MTQAFSSLVIPAATLHNKSLSFAPVGSSAWTSTRTFVYESDCAARSRFSRSKSSSFEAVRHTCSGVSWPTLENDSSICSSASGRQSRSRHRDAPSSLGDNCWGGMWRRLALAEGLSDELTAHVRLGLLCARGAVELARLPRGKQDAAAMAAMRQSATLVDQLLQAPKEQWGAVLSSAALRAVPKGGEQRHSAGLGPQARE